MDQETTETQESTFAASYSWLILPPEEDDTVEEVIRYTLDEIRFA